MPAVPGALAAPPIPPIASRLSRLLQLPTVKPEILEPNITPFADFAALLTDFYPLLHEHLELEIVAELGLLFRWRGSDTALASEPAVLMAHYDVVPAADLDGWTHPPFAGVIADGSVWGRGTLDDKGPLIVIVEAVEALLAQGFQPKRDTYLWFGGDEETGSTTARAAGRLFQERGLNPWLVLDEGGAVVDAPLPFIDVPASMIGVGEKGSVNVILEVSGAAGHASAPSGHSATARIADAVSKLERRQFPARLSPVVREMLATFIPHASSPGRSLLKLLTRAPKIGALLLASRGGDAAALVRTTIATTRLGGGTADNVLPSSATATVNCRIAPGDSVSDVVAHVRRAICDKQVRIRVTDANEPSSLSATDNEAFRLLKSAASHAYPEAIVAPYVVLAATDAKIFQEFSQSTYRFAPLRMTARDRASIHGVDERVLISSLEAGVRFHDALIRSL